MHAEACMIPVLRKQSGDVKGFLRKRTLLATGEGGMEKAKAVLLVNLTVDLTL